MAQFARNGVELPPGEFGIPQRAGRQADRVARPSSRAGAATASADGPDQSAEAVGRGRVVTAGGMVYVSSIGPIDPETGQVVPGSIKEHARQCLTNLQAQLEAAGSSLDKIAWASWSLKDATDFDGFNEEWVRWFPGDAPVGQGTLMPPLQRRAGFRVSLGVIAEA